MSENDVPLYAGQTYDPTITVTLASLVDSDAGSPTYNPSGLLDLTGWRLRGAIKTKPDPQLAPLAEVDTDVGGTFSILTQTALPWAAGSTLGQAVANFTPAQTAALPLRRLWVSGRDDRPQSRQW